MRSQLLIIAASVAISTAAVLPYHNGTHSHHPYHNGTHSHHPYGHPYGGTPLTTRDTCPSGDFCADCVATGNCGGQTVTLGIKSSTIDVGTIKFEDIANVIGQQCYADTESGNGACDPTSVTLPSTIQGEDGNVTVSISSDSFQAWAKDLFVSAITVALHGTSIANTGIDQDSGAGVTTVTVPESFFIALFSDPDKTVTIGIAVSVAATENKCKDLLGLGASLAGLAGPFGGAYGAALTFGSLFCPS